MYSSKEKVLIQLSKSKGRGDALDIEDYGEKSRIPIQHIALVIIGNTEDSVDDK